MIDGLADWLLACINDDEVKARAVDVSPDLHGRYQRRLDDGRFVEHAPDRAEFYVMRVKRSGIDGMPENVQDRPATELFATLNPTRVLAECETKRRLIEWVFEHAERLDQEWDCCHRAAGIRLGECSGIGNIEATAALGLLALPLADRPGYREEWRP